MLALLENSLYPAINLLSKLFMALLQKYKLIPRGKTPSVSPKIAIKNLYLR